MRQFRLTLFDSLDYFFSITTDCLFVHARVSIFKTTDFFLPH